jgi:hypothetical protein
MREKKKGRGGAPNPGRGWPGLGFAWPAGPGHRPPPPWPLPLVPWGRGKVHPLLTIQRGGGPRRREDTTIPRALLHGLLLPPPWCASPLSVHRPCLSLSPTWPPEGCVGDGNHHCDTSSCCGVFGSLFQSLYFRISAGNGVLWVIVVAVRVWVRGGAARVVPESLRQVLHDLEVGYVVFDSNACAGA